MRALSMRQDKHLQQKLLISKGMQLAFKALQLPALELSAFLMEEITNNPLLEMPNAPPFPLLMHGIPQIKEPDFLLMDLRRSMQSDNEKVLCSWIMHNLDNRGFCPLSITDIARHTGCCPLLVNTVVQKIQSFEGKAIAARNPQHALLLQLKINGKQNRLAFTIIEQHFELFLHFKIHALAKKTRTSIQVIQKEIQEHIQPLNPYPLPCSHAEPIQTIYPDISITEKQESLHIDIHNYCLPSIVFTKECEEYNGQHLRKFIANAKWLQRVVSRRASLLLTIASYIAEKNAPFFSGKTSTICFTTTSQLAKDLHLSISTIRRAVQEKWIATDYGLFAFSAFLSKADDVASSKKAIQNYLLQWIEKEDKKKPLTDAELALELKNLGKKCSRRTVTKYRKELSLHASHLRKQHMEGTK